MTQVLHMPLAWHQQGLPYLPGTSRLSSTSFLKNIARCHPREPIVHQRLGKTINSSCSLGVHELTPQGVGSISSSPSTKWPRRGVHCSWQPWQFWINEEGITGLIRRNTRRAGVHRDCHTTVGTLA